MARPKKDPSLLRDEVVRIPVSAEEKKLLMGAALATEGEFARWARPILIQAAEQCHPLSGKKREARQEARKRA